MKNRGFHYIFTWKICFYLFLGLVVSNILFFFLVGRPLGETYEQAMAVLINAREKTVLQALKMDVYLVVIVGALIFFSSLLMSHRVSGPVYRFEKSAESLAEGEFSLKVKLREKDEMKDVADEMDGAFAVLREKLLDVGRAAEQVEAAADALEDMAGRGEGRDAEAGELAARLESARRKLQEGVSFFKT